MVEQIQPNKEETILVTGANGGVGSLNVQIATNVFGAKVIALVGDALFETSLNVLKKVRTLYLKHITAYGSVLGTVAEFKRLLQAIAKGQVKPVIDRVFDLKDAKDGQLYFKVKGKLYKSGLNPVTTKKRTTTH